MQLDDVRRLQAARDYIDLHYRDPIDVPLLAGRAAMSVGHFQRAFKEAFGETPYAYVSSRRVERAMVLLRAGELSVTDVCWEVGFSSLGSFSSKFTTLVGVTPSQYREQDHSATSSVAPCVLARWARPVRKPIRNGEAPPHGEPLA